MKKLSARLDLHSLEVFHNVVSAASFSEAAKAMDLSQPTVSQHVQALEASLGIRLLDRSGKKVRPTAAGRALDHYAVRLIRLREEAAAAALSADGAIAGELVVAASTIPGTYIVPRAVKAMLDRHPDVRVEALAADTREVERMVAEENVELGITGASPVDRRVSGRSILTDELILIVPVGDPFASAGKRGIAASELGGRSFVMRETGSGSLEAIEFELASSGAGKLDVKARVGSTEAVLESVRVGVGISWVSGMAAARDLSRGDLVGVRVRGLSVKRDIFVVQRRGRTPSPAAAVFIEALASVAAR